MYVPSAGGFAEAIHIPFSRILLDGGSRRNGGTVRLKTSSVEGAGQGERRLWGRRLVGD